MVFLYHFVSYTWRVFVLEPIEPIKEKISIVSDSDLTKLLSEEREYKIITVNMQALHNIEELIQLLSRNKACLTTLELQGPAQELPISALANIATTVNECSNILQLSITDFKDTINIGGFLTNFRLEKLKYLNLSGTYLGIHARKLAIYLTTNSSLKSVDLTDTALVDSIFWDLLSKALLSNKVLADIRFGRAPIWPQCVKSLARGILSNTSALQLIDWEHPGFDENCAITLHYLEQLKMKELPWLQGGSSSAVAQNKNHNQNLPESDYKAACLELVRLQEFLNEKSNTRPSFELAFLLKDAEAFDLDVITAKIHLHQTMLKSLTIQCDTIENENPIITKESVSNFRSTIIRCTLLKAVSIENMQASFTPPRIKEFMLAIGCLPSLQILSCRKTYLGEAGVDALAGILKNNTLLYLDLTLAGLFNDYCFEKLEEALISNTSLRRLILGKSPMTRTWWNRLENALKQRLRQHPFTIDWMFSDRGVMDAQMRAMCDDLGKSQHALSHKTDAARDRFLNLRRGDRINDESTYNKLKIVLGYRERETIPEQPQDFELEPIAAKSPLVSSKASVSYGTNSTTTSSLSPAMSSNV